MDMSGMKTVQAKNLTKGDIISFEKWTDDLKVIEVTVEPSIVKVKTIGVCEDLHKEAIKEYTPDENLVIVRR